MYKAKIHKGYGRFTRGAAYAVSIDYEDGHRVHVETFYGEDGRTNRAEALRYAKRMMRRDSFPFPSNPYMPTGFDLKGVEVTP